MAIQKRPIKILATADWHIGKRRGPVLDGVNLRERDTERCIEALLETAETEKPDITMISGDLIDVAGTHSERGHHEERTVFWAISKLAGCSKSVVVLRGTPNHDGKEFFLALSDYCMQFSNVSIIMEPCIARTEFMDIVCIPGFDVGYFRAKFAGLSREEENEAFSAELGNLCMGLREACRTGFPTALMAHYTVPGCNMESGQNTFMQKFEPVLTLESLHAADYDLVCLGHIHRPQKLPNVPNAFYAGAVNALNFNDEGQERGFYIHEYEDRMHIESRFVETPYRKFLTIKLDVDDIGQINHGALDMVAAAKWAGKVKDKIVRVFYDSTKEDKKALNTSALEKKMLEDGAFMLWDIAPQAMHEDPNKKQLGKRSDPEENLREYLSERGFEEEKVLGLVNKARPIMQEALANGNNSILTGEFEPVSIEVKNYRNYVSESFDFTGISFCTINGPNGAGKSSLFMDAIVDCLYEEPREGDITGWIRKADGVRSGSISFVFRVGERMYRVARSRTRSRSLTLSLSEKVGGEWEKRTLSRAVDTQKAIEQILGMDCMTFKSCALIMQDQYGLFLQADKKERMGILSRLLGLEVYDSMHKAAGEKAKEYGARKKEAQHKIEIHEAAIQSYGDPKAGLEAVASKIKALSSRLKAETEERDKHKLAFDHQKEAVERRDKILAEVVALQKRRAAAEQNRDAQQEIICNSSKILSQKEDIEAGVSKYVSLLEKEKFLSGQAVLYSAKKAEAEELRKQETNETATIAGIKDNISRKTAKMEELQQTGREEKIRTNAAEYERYAELLKQMMEIQAKYQEALSIKERCAYAVDSKRAYINQEKQRLKNEKGNLRRRMELMEKAGCVDIDHAKCSFLADALDAKEKFPNLEKEMEEFLGVEEKLLQELEEALEKAKQDVKKIGYDEALLEKYREKASELSGAPLELKKMEEREGRAALIKTSLENLQSNLEEAEHRLAAVREKAYAAEKERDSFARASQEFWEVTQQLPALKAWLEKEKQIPVAEEQNKTAKKRVLELSEEIASTNVEIAAKQEDIQRERASIGDVQELETLVEQKEHVIAGLNDEIGKWQKTAGSLQQKLEDEKRLKKEIGVLQQEINEFSAETADYDILKEAFSYFGIPHQIVRTVLPQLEGAASQIIGQMTGGRMGISFQTERVQVSGKKEVLELDVLIEEYGKPALPYLSKSGGEKVKASLSVILALAEIKSSSAGVQLGVLFIDEPPFLDGDGVQAYCDALETIQKRYSSLKIMAITHDPTMKARFPQSLDVVKTDEGSKVVY